MNKHNVLRYANEMVYEKIIQRVTPDLFRNYSL